MNAGRIFLPRQRATYLLGLMDAAHRREPEDVVPAMMNEATGEVFEAQPGESLHAQIVLRVGKSAAEARAGWTAPATMIEDIERQIRERPNPFRKAPRPCPCGDMTINDCAGECGRPGSDRR